MEDDPRPVTTTLVPAGNGPAEGSEGNFSVSLIDRVLQRVQQHSYLICDAYLRFRGIRDDLPPSITIAIPVAEETAKLTQTIESLLSARYFGLSISVVGPRAATKITKSLPGSPNIQFFETRP